MEKMDKWTKIWLLGLIVFIGVFSLLIIACSFFLVDYENGNESNFNSYLIASFNTISSETRPGIVRVPRKILKNKEFITFRSENSKVFSVISSKLSNEEFECYGTCFCDDDKERRSVNMNTLSKSLYFLVSSISLSLAIRIASRYFSEECFLSLENICSSDNVKTEINFCKSKFEAVRDDHSVSKLLSSKKDSVAEREKNGVNELSEAEIAENMEVRKNNVDEGFEREFHCEGCCTPNGDLKREEAKLEGEKFECRRYTTEARVTIIEYGKLGFMNDAIYKGNVKAMVLFRKDHLIPFCRFVSEFKYAYEYTYPSGKKQIQKKTVHLCSASLSGKNPGGNVCCYLLDPFAPFDGIRERQRLKQLLEKDKEMNDEKCQI